MKYPSILFVCSANICRSPMAQGLFQAHLRTMRPDDWHNWRVESAGTWGENGQAISTNSYKVLAQRGIDLKAHRSRIITADLIAPFDLILTMEAGHKEALALEFPHLAARVYMLSEMMGELRAVTDPYGASLEAYQQTALLIEKMITTGFERIAALTAAKS